MQYNVQAVLLDGTLIFTATTGWIPNKGDELQVGEYVFVVHNVRYKIQDGTTHSTNVVLTLTYKVR